MASLQSNEIWELVEPPPNRRIIGSKCIFKRKVDADEEVERYKARLVAQGCTQRFGLDYEEIFSPVVRFESIRSAIALGAQHKLQLHQMDVSTALLLGCRLGWRCWRQKINLLVRVPSRRCFYQLEEQQTDLCGSIHCLGRVCCTGHCIPRSHLASATHGRPVKWEHPRNNDPWGQPVSHMSCQEPEHSGTHHIK